MVIPYAFLDLEEDTTRYVYFTPEQKQQVRSALDEFGKYTCVRFDDESSRQSSMNRQDYVAVRNMKYNGLCSASVGRCVAPVVGVWICTLNFCCLT